MKSLFTVSPFSGPAFVPAFASPERQQADARAAMGQSADDVTGLSRGIEDLLKQLPPEVLGTYQKQYQDCLKKLDTGGVVGLVAGGRCLYDLYQALKTLIASKGGPLVPLPPALTTFPVLPAAITAVGLIVLVYGLTKL